MRRLVLVFMAGLLCAGTAFADEGQLAAGSDNVAKQQAIGSIAAIVTAGVGVTAIVAAVLSGGNGSTQAPTNTTGGKK